MALVDSIVGESGEAGAFGSRDDWMSNVLGSKVFGKPISGYVSVSGGVPRAVVRLPALPKDVGFEGLGGFFRVAAGVAARGGYTTVEDLEAAGKTPVDVKKPVWPSLAAGRVFDDTPLGNVLDDLNAVVVDRQVSLGLQEEVASGSCYLAVVRAEFRDAAESELGKWPTLGNVFSAIPAEWFRPAEELAKVGVSLRSGVLHFEDGWGQGALSAHDVLTVVQRAKVYPGKAVDQLLDAVVGGNLPFCGKTDCRARALDLACCSGVAVSGRTVSELRDSPGWAAYEAALEQVDSSVEFTGLAGGTVTMRQGAGGLLSALRGDGNRPLCPCWHAFEVPAGKQPCSECGFFVNPEDHEDRCRAHQVGRPVLANAWLGDAVQMLDVRYELLRRLPHQEAVRWQDRFTSASGQAKYLREFRGMTFSKDGKASDWFEANYGAFRGQYLVFLRDAVALIPGAWGEPVAPSFTVEDVMPFESSSAGVGGLCSHDSNVASKLDPRVDTDRGGSRAAGGNAHGSSGVAGVHGTHSTAGVRGEFTAVLRRLDELAALWADTLPAAPKEACLVLDQGARGLACSCARAGETHAALSAHLCAQHGFRSATLDVVKRYAPAVGYVSLLAHAGAVVVPGRLLDAVDRCVEACCGKGAEWFGVASVRILARAFVQVGFVGPVLATMLVRVREKVGMGKKNFFTALTT